MFEEPIVTFEAGDGFSLVGIDLVIDEEDFTGLHIAVDNLAKDFSSVTKQEGNVKVNRSLKKTASKNCIFVGSLAKSPTIRRLKEEGKLATTEIDGKWESWMTACVKTPFGDYENALVISGSDKRGAIFGTYSLSQQIGVSP